jgi:hypothetical protein
LLDVFTDVYCMKGQKVVETTEKRTIGHCW